MYDLATVAAFKKVAETKSFTTAALLLRMTPSALSRKITRLEERLGVELLVRTTRHLRLTKIGEQFYTHCAKGMTEIDRAIQIASKDQREPNGALKIGATVFFGKAHLIPATLLFLAKHPKVSIDVSLGHPACSFHESGIDILVRTGTIRGQRITHDKLAPMHQIVCATPGYLERCGVPKLPQDLMKHNCLLFTRPNVEREWVFMKGSRREYVAVSGNFQSDSVEGLLRAVMSGMGVTRLPSYVVAPELRNGKLIPIFPSGPDARSTRGYMTPTNTMKAYYLKSRYPDPTVRAFIRFLKARFTADYNWEGRGEHS